MLRALIRAAALFGAGIAVVGCAGGPTPASNVNASSAQLHANLACKGSCQYYFQYWPHGSTAAPKTTPRRTASANGGLPVSETVTGLSSGTLYHFQLCSRGGTTGDFVCVGPGYSSVNEPGGKPTDIPNGASNFRTASGSDNATVDLGRPLNTWEAANNLTHNGDVGDSAVYAPGKAMWIFGDTFVYDANLKWIGGVGNNTGATATYTQGDPSSLVLTPLDTGKSPSYGLSRVTDPSDGTGCTVAPSGPTSLRWPEIGTGAPGKVIIGYHDYCTQDKATRSDGLAEYDPVSKTFTNNRQCTPFEAGPPNFLPPQKKLVGPIRPGNGYVYLYGYVRAKTGGEIYVARVSDNPSAWCWDGNFSWWDGSKWQPDYTKATSIAPTTDIGDAGVEDFRSVKGVYVMLVRGTNEPGMGETKFKVYTAKSPQGPWTPGASGRIPDACETGPLYCYALLSHPELSTASTLTYSWASSEDLGGHRHIRIGTMPW